MNVSLSVEVQPAVIGSKGFWALGVFSQRLICACVQDFEMNGELKLSVICLLEEVLRDPDLLPQERKATANILRYTTEHSRVKQQDTMSESLTDFHFKALSSLFFFIVISYFSPTLVYSGSLAPLVPCPLLLCPTLHCPI